MSRSCQEIQESLYLLDDGELGKEEQSQVEQHLVACESCQALHAEVRSLRIDLATLMAEVAPDGFRNRTLARLGAREPGPRIRWMRWASVAAAAGLLLTTGWFAWKDSMQQGDQVRLVADADRKSNEDGEPGVEGRSRFKGGGAKKEVQGGLPGEAAPGDSPSSSEGLAAQQALVQIELQAREKESPNRNSPLVGKQAGDAVPGAGGAGFLGKAPDTKVAQGPMAPGSDLGSEYTWQIPADQLDELLAVLQVAQGKGANERVQREDPSAPGAPDLDGPASSPPPTRPVTGGRGGQALSGARSRGASKKQVLEPLEGNASEAPKEDVPPGWQEALSKVAALRGPSDRVHVVVKPVELMARSLVASEPEVDKSVAQEDRKGVPVRRARIMDRMDDALPEHLQVTLRRVTADEWRRQAAGEEALRGWSEDALPSTRRSAVESAEEAKEAVIQEGAAAVRLWVLVIERVPVAAKESDDG